MKKVIVAVAVVLVLLVLAAVAIPFLIPTGFVVAKLEAAVREATGRELAIKGPVRFAVLPRLEIDAEDVSFANPPGASEKEMASIGALRLRLRPFALLRGDLVVDTFVLERPRIDLEIARNGEPNWRLAAPLAKPESGSKNAAAPSPAPKKVAPSAPPAKTGGGFALGDIRLGDVRLVDGTVVWQDARTGVRQEFDKIDATLALPDLAGPMHATGSARWNGQVATIRLDLGSPKAFLAGAQTDAVLAFAAPAVRFDFKGRIARAASVSLLGDAALDIPSLRGLSAWTGFKLPASRGGFGPFSLAGKLDLDGDKASFTKARLAFDGTKGTGDLLLDRHGSKPYLKGDLALDRLVLTPYLPPEGAGKAPASAPRPASPEKPPGKPSSAPAAAPPAPPAAAASGWSDKPLDVSALRLADADFSLALGALEIDKIAIGASALALHLKDGRLAADVSRMALYQGNGTAQIRLDGAGAAPTLSLHLTLAKVAAQPLLAASIGFDRVAGEANGEVDLNAKGRSERELISDLGGKGSLRFLNGAVRGIDLEALLRNPLAAIDPASRQEGETRFSQLTGTFTMTKGIARNDDLALVSQVLHVSGAGTVNLPQRRVDYRIVPKLGAAGQATPLTIPVAVSGPWDHLSYRPQLDNVLQQPDKALDSLKGLLAPKSGSAGTTPPSGTGSGKPVDILRGILGVPKK